MPARTRLTVPWPLILLACAVACVAVSPQSFWIDETQTALKTLPPTLHGWWQALCGEGDSTVQMPLYMFYVWAWTRMVPVSELALRTANIPWFFLGFWSIAHFLKNRPTFRNVALLVYSVHPFVWYYVDEARPYMMQLSASVLVFSAVFAALDTSDTPETPDTPLDGRWWWLFWSGCFVLCGSALLGVPWAVVAVAMLATCRPGFFRSMFGPGRIASVVLVSMLLALGVFYGWTLMLGLRPGYTGMTFASIPYAFYELLGFAGLGPGRADLRTLDAALFMQYVPLPAALGLAMAYALVRAAAVRFDLSRSRLIAVCATAGIPTALVFVLGFTQHFRVLARHLAPLFPFLLAAVAFAIFHLWRSRTKLDRAVAVLVVLLLALSAIDIRFAARHQKDDNRGAAAIAEKTLDSGGSVLWVADQVSATYYGLPVSLTEKPKTAYCVWWPTQDQLAAMKPPTLIVLCKPDLFDRRGATREYIATNGYHQTATLPAFTIWTK